MRLRDRIRALFSRGSPMPVTPEYTSVTSFGLGLGPDPMQQALLERRQGVAALSQRAIRRRIGSIEWQTSRKVQTEADTVEQEILDDHPLTRLLMRPHPDFSGRQLFGLLGESLVTVGEGYWYIVDNAFGRPATLQPLQVGNTWPIIRNGVIRSYGHRDGKGQQRELRVEDVVRFWDPDLATLYTARGSFAPNWAYSDSMAFQAEHMRSHWQNDATPKVVLKAAAEFAENPDNETWQRFMSKWEQSYHGRRGVKRGLPGLIPTGWDVVMIAAQSGADVTPLLEWLEQEELMNYGVPNALLGKVRSGDRSSAETTSWIFDQYTISPLADLIRDTINHILVPRFSEGDTDLVVEYVPFVAPDKEFELKRDTELLAAKVVSIDEVRRSHGRNEAEEWNGRQPVGTFGDQPYTGEIGAAGDNPFTPQDESQGTEDEPSEEPEVDPEDEERRRLYVKQAFAPERQWGYRRQMEQRWMGRMRGRVAQVFRLQEGMALERYRKSLSRHSRAPGDELIDEQEWGLLWETLVEPVRRSAYAETGQFTLNLLASGEFELTPHVVQELRRQGASLVTNANSTTIQALREELVAGAELGESVQQLEKRIQAVFQGRRRNAETIARTELLRAVEDAQVESFKQSGVVERKRWNSSRDGRVRDTHVESLIGVVGLNQPFTLPDGEQAMYPGQSSLSARNSINCRCFVTPVFEDD